MMMHSDISGKATLADHSGETGWWGLGAVEGLQSEVFIEDGIPWVSRAAQADGDEVVVEAVPGAEATLLVAAGYPAGRRMRFRAPSGLSELGCPSWTQKSQRVGAGFSLVRRDRDSNSGTK